MKSHVGSPLVQAEHQSYTANESREVESMKRKEVLEKPSQRGRD